MSEMQPVDVHKIVKLLVGPINPIGSTNEDNIRLSNLSNMMLLVKGLLKEIKDVSHSKNSQAYSVARAGKAAGEFLEELKEGDGE